MREVARLKSLKVKFNSYTFECSVKSGFIEGSRVQVYFLDNDDCFEKPDMFIYDRGTALLAHGALQLSILLNWIPDVIHCNGWRTAFIPYLLRNNQEYTGNFANTRVVLQLHDLENYETFPAAEAVETGLTEIVPGEKHPLVSNGDISILKPGMASSDGILSSNLGNLRQQIRTIYKGLRGIEKSFYEIPNGVDVKTWGPEHDKHLTQKFTCDDFIDGKARNKAELFVELGFGEETQLPLVIVGSEREDEHSQAALRELLDKISQINCKMIILGTHTPELEELIRNKILEYPGKFSLEQKSDGFRHRVVGSADIFLLPILNKDCEYYLVYSLMYGAVPIVVETDISLEKIVPYSPKTGQGNGFLFEKDDFSGMLDSLRSVLKLYPDHNVWQNLQSVCMQEDFSWCRTAEQYIEYYESLVNSKSYSD